MSPANLANCAGICEICLHVFVRVCEVLLHPSVTWEIPGLSSDDHVTWITNISYK